VKRATFRPMRAALVLSTVAAVAVRGTPVTAQQKASPAPSNTKEMIQSQSVLTGRNRVTLHPGNPLNIVGLEQGDRDLRADTPALQQSDRTVAMVDEEENYRRTLAMYESGTTVHEPLTARAMPWSSVSGPTPQIARYSSESPDAVRSAASAARAAADRAGSGASRVAWICAFGLSAGALFAIWAVRRWTLAGQKSAAPATRRG